MRQNSIDHWNSVRLQVDNASQRYVGSLRISAILNPGTHTQKIHGNLSVFMPQCTLTLVKAVDVGPFREAWQKYQQCKCSVAHQGSSLRFLDCLCSGGSSSTVNRFRHGNCSNLVLFFGQLNLVIVSSTQNYFTKSSNKNLMDYLCISILRYQDQLRQVILVVGLILMCSITRLIILPLTICASVWFLALQSSVVLIA